MEQEQDVRVSAEKTLEQFRAEQEQLEKLAFDALNLSDRILTSAGRAMYCLEEPEQEKAILDAKDCLVKLLEYTAQLSETIHLSEAAMVQQMENLELVQMAVDYLSCDWDE